MTLPSVALSPCAPLGDYVTRSQLNDVISALTGKVISSISLAGALSVDTIAECTPAAGVTIESVLIDSGLVSGVSVAAHASRHQDTGADEISVTGLSGLLGDAQTPVAHALDSAYHTGDLAYTQLDSLVGTGASKIAAGSHVSQHQDTGADEISVTGLSGLLADAQTPVAHLLVSAYHTAAGLTTGYVVRASAATTFAWAQLQHSDLGGVGTSDHHVRYADSEAIAAVQNEATLDLTGDVTIASGKSLSVGGGLNVGTATGAGTGQIKTSDDVGIGGAANIGTSTRALTVSAGVTGTATAFLELQGSRTTTASVCAIAFYHQAAYVAALDMLRDGADDAGALRLFTKATGAALTERIRVTGAGLVGIGRTPTTNKLEVEGDASKTVAGLWLANSDRRIKERICTIEGALGTIGRLRPVEFYYNEAYREANPSVLDKPYFGFIAQEFQEVFPDSVKTDGEGYLQMDSYAVIPYLARAVQELSHKVQVLEKQLGGAL